MAYSSYTHKHTDIILSCDKGTIIFPTYCLLTSKNYSDYHSSLVALNSKEEI